jgi:hypothetical protein
MWFSSIVAGLHRAILNIANTLVNMLAMPGFLFKKIDEAKNKVERIQTSDRIAI